MRFNRLGSLIVSTGLGPRGNYTGITYDRQVCQQPLTLLIILKKNNPPSVSHLLKRLLLAISTHNPYVHTSVFSRWLASFMHLLELNFRGLFYVQEIRKNITRNIGTTVVQCKTYIYILK